MLWVCRHFELNLDGGGRGRVMGILNVTPDSFSDGGRFFEVDDALRQARTLVDAGADFIDVGGESTRPGAEPVEPAVELDRVLPVIRALSASFPSVLLSVDTRRAEVARAALRAGAQLVNDISGLQDPDMASVVADAGCGLIVMHLRGEPRTMQSVDLSSPDIVVEVLRHLASVLDRAAAAGVSPEAIAIDPGIGFGKTVDQNAQILARLDELAVLRRPIVIGLSRKSFLGALTERGTDSREHATTAAHALALARGAHVLRTHDVGAAIDAAAVTAAILRPVGQRP